MTQTTFEIRKARPDEGAVLSEMILAMAWESEGRELDRQTLGAGIRAVFQNPALGTYWVIARDGQVIGNTLMTVEWSDWNNAPYWWIQSLYLKPEYRGQGVFDQLLGHLEQEAQREGVCEIRLYVERNNGRAIRAYEKNGFDAEHYLCMLKPLRN